MNPPQMYTCSSSWTPLPPRTDTGCLGLVHSMNSFYKETSKTWISLEVLNPESRCDFREKTMGSGPSVSYTVSDSLGTHVWRLRRDESNHRNNRLLNRWHRSHAKSLPGRNLCSSPNTKDIFLSIYCFTLDEQLTSKIMRRIRRQVKDTPEKQGRHREQAPRTVRCWQKGCAADQEPQRQTHVNTVNTLLHKYAEAILCRADSLFNKWWGETWSPHARIK